MLYIFSLFYVVVFETKRQKDELKGGKMLLLFRLFFFRVLQVVVFVFFSFFTSNTYARSLGFSSGLLNIFPRVLLARVCLLRAFGRCRRRRRSRLEGVFLFVPIVFRRASSSRVRSRRRSVVWLLARFCC